MDILIGNTGGDRLLALDWIAAHLGKPRLREVALAHVGNGPGGLTDTRVVVAAGTGGGIDLSSWSLKSGTLEPRRLTNSAPPLAGWTVYLDVLEPPQPSALTLNPFVMGRIGADSNLWLTLRRVDDAGQQTELSTVRFGTNENFRVCDYAIAHQVVADANGGGQRFLLVTPMIGFNAADQLEMRVAVWSVHVPTGSVTFYVDGNHTLGVTNLPPKGARLQIVREADGRFMVSYLNRQAQLEYLYLDVNASGAVSHYGRGTFTLTFNGATTVPVVTPDFALCTLNSNNFTTLLSGTNCRAQLALWRDSDPDCGVNCDSRPVLITNRAITLLGSADIETPRVNNFALCRISDSLALSAVVYGANTLRLDTWKLPANGQANPVSRSTNIITGPSPVGASPHVKAFSGSTPMLLDSQFDALTGRLEDGQLRLDRWRVATEPSR